MFKLLNCISLLFILDGIFFYQIKIKNLFFYQLITRFETSAQVVEFIVQPIFATV